MDFFKCFNCGSRSWAICPVPAPVDKTIIADFPAIECLRCGKKWLDCERIAELEKYLSSLDIVPVKMTNEQILKLQKN